MGGRIRMVGRLAALAAVMALAGCDGSLEGAVDGGTGIVSGGFDGGAGGFAGCVGVWSRAAPAQSPPGVWHAAMAPDGHRGDVLLYGGILAGQQGRSNQAWTWSGTSQTWRNRTPSPLPLSWPPALADHRMVWDADRQAIVMFGGSDHAGTANADLWAWNGDAGTWTKLTPTALPAAWPAPREGAGMTFDGVRRRLVVASGFTPTTGPGVADDIWEWNDADNTWTDRTPDPRPAEWFEGRQYPTLAMDPSGPRPVLLGGFSSGGSLRDEMWAWNATTATWTDLKALPRSGSWPPGGSWTTITDYVCPGKLIAVGTDLLPSPVSPNSDIVQVWQWDGNAREWTDLTPSPLPAVYPPAGQTPAAAPDPATAQIVLFGGQPRPGGVPSNETWIWSR